MAPFDGGLAALRFPYEGGPAAGVTLEVAPGVRWLRMRLPFALDHINLWLLEDGDGWTIVDCGIATRETREVWERIFAAELGGRPVKRVMVTHYHPDHIGLAGWLCERWQVPLWISETDWLFARMLTLDRDEEAIRQDQLPFYRRTGLDAAALEVFAKRGNSYRSGVTTVPRGFHRLADGQEVLVGGRRWRVVVGRGHAPEHSCLWCPELDVFIAGDQILPKISPNIGVWPTEPEGNPLAQYLSSLRRIRDLVPASVLVLPSHNLPFRGVDIRIDQLLQHHADRLGELEAACEVPRTIAELTPILFRRKLNDHELSFAVGETLSHVHYLLSEERLVRRERDDGVYLFRRS
jgi:glyoxylase-like metal-dependent hydrolase (beta-lactamase superfamily II)